MIHCMLIIETVIGNLFSEEKHQVIMDFATFSGSLYLGIRHLIRGIVLPIPNMYKHLKNLICKIYREILGFTKIYKIKIFKILCMYGILT